MSQKEKQVWIIIETTIEKNDYHPKKGEIDNSVFEKDRKAKKNTRHKNKSRTNIHVKFLKSKK